MRRFRGSVAEIEKMTEVFIKESFRKLRSAEGAFELVQNFQKIGTFLSGFICIFRCIQIFVCKFFKIFVCKNL
jgi:hypothetical protein